MRCQYNEKNILQIEKHLDEDLLSTITITLKAHFQGAKIDCQFKAQAGKQFCIFHDPVAHQTQMPRITRRFKQMVKRGQRVFVGYHLGYVSLTAEKPLKVAMPLCHFHGESLFEGDFESIELSGAVFHKEVHFRSTREQGGFMGQALFFRTDFRESVTYESICFHQRPLFLGASFKAAYFIGTNFLNGANFGRTTFEWGADFTAMRSNGYMDFSYAMLSRTSFEGALFSQEARFTGADFACVDFEGATFEEKAYFGKALFYFQCNFTKTSFHEYADFSCCQFHEAIFRNAQFAKGAVFSESVFGTVSFEETSFDSVWFHEAIFAELCIMAAHFERLGSFDRTLFNRDTIEPSVLDWAKMSNPCLTWFDGATVGPNGEVRFIQPTEYNQRNKVERNLGIDHVSFRNAQVERFNFQNVEWSKLEGRRAIVEEALMGKPLFEYLTPQEVQEVYARLRANLEKALRYAEAGDFFVGEMEMRRLQLKGGRKLLPPLSNIPAWAVLNIYRLLALYGESLVWPVYWVILTIFLFGFVRMLIQPISGSQLGDFYMQSVMAFFQMRSEPGVDVVERLVSVPILGSLFIVLRRKFERRP
jgi:uncharacterized protein YjbI with pentapeptide repeats